MDLVGQEKETFRLLEAWGARQKRGKLKFFCEDIIKKSAESAEALKTLPDGWYAYEPEKDPKVVERLMAAEEKAKMKAAQKIKRQGAVKEESTCGCPREEPADELALLEQLRIIIPPTSDFAAIMRIYECAARIAEAVEDSPEILLLKKKVKKAEAINSDLEANLLDREDKLAYCNKELVPDLLEENRYMRGVINSLSSVEAQITEAEGQFAAREVEAEKAALVEEELKVARELESEAQARVVVLHQQVQLLESGLKGWEGRTAGARTEGFLRAQELLLVQDPDVDLGLLSLGNEVLDGKVVRPREGGEPEVLYNPSEDTEE